MFGEDDQKGKAPQWAKEMAKLAMANAPENHLIGDFSPTIISQAEAGKRFAQFAVKNDSLYFLFDAEKELGNAGFVVHRLDDSKLGDILITW